MSTFSQQDLYSASKIIASPMGKARRGPSSKVMAKSLLAVLLLAGNSSLLPASNRSPEPTITVDFATTTSPHLPSIGFLSGLQSTQVPLALKELRPTIWRVGTSPAVFYPGDSAWPGIYNSLVTSGVIPELIISDAYGYPPGVKLPFQNWSGWENTVRRVADENKGRTVMYDVWNEPDESGWTGTQAQFFETYVRAYKILVEELGPNVIVGGPSLSQYNETFIQNFLDYCLANGAKVNFLSWHESQNTLVGITNISAHLASARMDFEHNPTYAPLSIQQLQLNEMIGPTYGYSPGGILAYLNQAEMGGADAAIKACWTASDGSSDCFNTTLDGLSTPWGHPRAAWWAYQLYAEGLTNRAAVTVSEPDLAAIASPLRSDRKSAQVLLSYCHPGQGQVNISVDLNGLDSLTFLKHSHSVHVQIQTLADTGQAAVVAPGMVSDTVLNIENGGVTLTIPRAYDGHLFVVLLTAP